MITRARNVHHPNTFLLKLGEVIQREVFSVIKWDTLCPGDGTYPTQQDKKERARIKELKKGCYLEVGRRIKNLGVFSSKTKKELLCTTLAEAIKEIERHNAEMQAFIGPSRMPRGVVQMSVLRALLNGLRKKMKLGDAMRMPAFDDHGELE